jgi:hypothetical protein
LQILGGGEVECHELLTWNEIRGMLKQKLARKLDEAVMLRLVFGRCPFRFPAGMV